LSRTWSAGVDPFGLSFSETLLATQNRFELFGNGFDIANEWPVAARARRDDVHRGRGGGRCITTAAAILSADHFSR
jgi:hypothetical protein